MFEKTTDVTRRLNQWRELRYNATSEQEVLEAFSQVKILPRYLDYWTPKDWPNPFEIIEHGYFCATGIAILLYQTLGNLKYLNPSETTWKVISNHVWPLSRYTTHVWTVVTSITTAPISQTSEPHPNISKSA